MGKASRWSLDQALTWAVWRDQSLVDQLGTGFKKFRTLWNRRLLYTAQYRPGTGKSSRGGPEAASAIGGYSDVRDAVAFNGPPLLAQPSDLFQACALGRLRARGEFRHGVVQSMPPSVWFEGGGGPHWRDISFEVADVKEVFPPFKRRGQRGPAAKKRDAVVNELLQLLESGALTSTELRDEKLTALAARYGVSRDLVRRAVALALERFHASGAIKTPTQNK